MRLRRHPALVVTLALLLCVWVLPFVHALWAAEGHDGHSHSSDCPICQTFWTGTPALTDVESPTTVVVISAAVPVPDIDRQAIPSNQDFTVSGPRGPPSA